MTQAATRVRRLNDLPIGRKMLLGGGALMLLFVAFIAAVSLGYQAASRSHALAKELQMGARDLGRLLDLIEGHLTGEHQPEPPAASLEALTGPFSSLEGRYADQPVAPVFAREFMSQWRRLHQRAEAVLASGVPADPAAVLTDLRRFQEQGRVVTDTLYHLMEQAQDEARSRNAATIRLLALIGSLLIAAILCTFYVLHRNIAGRLARMNAIIGHMEDSGDLSVRLEVGSEDEIGHLARTCNNLASATQETLERERQEKEDLSEMVEIILGVVDTAAKGDLTQFLMEFHGSRSVDRLANGVRAMIDSLNRLISDVRESGFQVTQSTSEISAGAVQQEATTSELAATSNEISASASEIAATSKELVHTMAQVYRVMQDATTAAERGQHVIDSMEESINAMVSGVDTISAKLETLSEKAGTINLVVSTITKVADQTNLLSLNAAIEAEKAGEYGKGFAVVATEIRRLADQTAVSTWDIEQMVKEIQAATSASVMAMEKVSREIHNGVNNVIHVSGELSGINEKVQAVLPEFESVKDSIETQSEGAGQISESIRQLNQSVQETAESLRRSNTAAARLKDAVQVLNNGVARFTIA